MARVKDLWFSEVPVKDAEGKTVRDPQGRPVTEKKNLGSGHVVFSADI